jgi:hypothetical protein
VKDQVLRYVVQKAQSEVVLKLRESAKIERMEGAPAPAVPPAAKPEARRRSDARRRAHGGEARFRLLGRGRTHVLHGRTDLGPVDFAALRRRPSGNDALICPPGFCGSATSDAQAPVFRLCARRARRPPRRHGARRREGRGAARQRAAASPFRPAHAACSAILIVIDAVVLPSGPDGATLALYSRSLVGRKDFGVNGARVRRWLAALNAAG